MLGSGMNINWGGHMQGKGITMIHYIRLNRNYGQSALDCDPDV